MRLLCHQTPNLISMPQNPLTRTLIVIAIPAAYAVFVRLFFGVDDWQSLFYVMSYSFLFCLPTIVGALTICLSPMARVQKLAYRFFMPWVPIFFFFLITLAAALEGWACWLMVLPLFLLASSLGGLIAGYFRLKNNTHKTKVYVSVLVLLPFLLAPVESLLGPSQDIYKAYTYVDINSSADRIWNNVTRVRTIPEEEDHGWITNWLGFPRPVRAELDRLGVGGYRKAIFTKGLVFHETVTEYAPETKMVFEIKADPQEIPSAAMDEHVVIGGRFLNVLNGTYELEKISNHRYRLHLYSHFVLKTSFNFYAGWWATLIMKDIQQNILQVEKRRAETD